MAAPKPPTTIAILSIGDMGLGVAKLLRYHNYRVLTNLAGRSPATRIRAESASIELVDTDEELLSEAQYILSIVPPRDARATAERIVAASLKLAGKDSEAQKQKEPVYYLDLNAISPSSVRAIGDRFQEQCGERIRFVDGGIIGGPPRLANPNPSSSPSREGGDETKPQWTVPSIPLSGPYSNLLNPTLAATLKATSLSLEIGAASGLKCCFAALTKGTTALAILSFSTAARLGVLPALRSHLQTYSPRTKEQVEKSLVGMSPKAYRWVAEMREIGGCFGEEGGWDNVGEGEAGSVFQGIADVYKFVADGTVLGEERVEKRVRGLTAEEVAEAVKEGLEKVPVD
ncbi:6-phosphogluconate dehydrogenase C-terminal domain-like protein [Aulographum hederae CBS 113979]|uniref:6-phosphogluconate dehydrogenase C-terminal domain-like protein n=1 Tax=Aulographum hederae CBS 113979 TaxID=1176131 RepID=A0A6G1GTT4_9PEZI|nr:6-phosphogluconate dehydrogenase C-terminal domain-like protein [Aulographum hederae CBS 113979]